MSIDSLAPCNARLLGNPDAGQTIVFVNGLGTDQSAWKEVLPAFAADFRLLLFDNVGSVESNRDNFQKNPYRYLNANGYPQPSPVFPNQNSVRSPFAPPGADGVLAVGQAQPAPAFQHE